MNCYVCGESMEFLKAIPFDEHTIDGFTCFSCGETYFDPEQAQNILLLNKTNKEKEYF